MFPASFYAANYPDEEEEDELMQRKKSFARYESVVTIFRLLTSCCYLGYCHYMCRVVCLSAMSVYQGLN